MRSRSTRLTGALAVVVVLALAATVTSEAVAGSRPAGGAAGPYMRVCGSQFCIGSSTFYPYGATEYESTPQVGIDNPAGAIALARSQHLNTIRLVNFLNHDGHPSTAPYAPATWAKVDTFVATAEAANIKILLDLSDLKAELWNACVDPYTHLRPWAKFLAFVARRVNTVTGSTYATDPGIVLVTFTGEPLPVGTHTFTRASGRSCTITYTSSQLTRFYASVEGAWKQLDPNHLTAAGGMANVDLPNSGIDWQSIFADPANDVCAFKTYGHMYSWLPNGARYCRDVLHKPWFNDEWGFTQSMGDAARSQFFQAELANTTANGGAGNFYWNANDQVAPTSYDVGPGTPLTQAVVVADAPA